MTAVNNLPILISLIAAIYLAVVYLLLTIAHRTQKIPRP